MQVVLTSCLCMLQVHGVFMAVSFVALLPISVIFAATRDRLWGPRIWFQAHRAINVSPSPLKTSLQTGQGSSADRHIGCLQC